MRRAQPIILSADYRRDEGSHGSRLRGSAMPHASRSQARREHFERKTVEPRPFGGDLRCRTRWAMLPGANFTVRAGPELMDDRKQDEEIARIHARLKLLEAEGAKLKSTLGELERRRALVVRPDHTPVMVADSPTAIATLSTSDKVALFRRLFVGRPDVFPLRWENRKTGKSGYAPACANEWAKGICGKPRVKCGECPHQAFIPISDEMIEKHLRGGDSLRSSAGDFVAGVYPMLPDDTCWFLAADFDKESWAADASAMIDTCRAKGIPAALERSRSGNGGHVWIFFSEPVAARTARQLGAAIVTETMERRPEIGFASYDRFFPSQDTMPTGGFGNLIALPLQTKAARARQQRLHRQEPSSLRRSVGLPFFTATTLRRRRVADRRRRGDARPGAGRPDAG